MSLLADWEIVDHVENWRELGLKGPMIENFEPEQVKHYTPTGADTVYGAISWGTSSYGYDFRVGTRFKVFNRIGAPVIDPKNFNAVVLEDFEVEPHGAIAVPPHSFVLATTMERFRIPRNVLVQVLGKSTYARCGLILNVTPLEPEWEGEVTIELSNTTPLPLLIYACEGIGQALFHRQTRVCKRSYADKKGKYQRQNGITLARV